MFVHVHLGGAAYAADAPTYLAHSGRRAGMHCFEWGEEALSRTSQPFSLCYMTGYCDLIFVDH